MYCISHISPYVDAPIVIILYHSQTIIKVDPKSHRFIHGDHKKDKYTCSGGGSCVYYGSELSWFWNWTCVGPGSEKRF